MAFATTNVRTGIAGDAWVVRGNWTGAATDGTGTFTVGGGLVESADFWETSGTTPSSVRFPVVVGTPGTTTQLTINYTGKAVTTGRFRVVYR